MDYSKMTMDELTAEMQKITEQRAALKLIAQRIQEAIDVKNLQESINKLAGNLSAAERNALLQVIRPSGIESQEAVQGF